MPFVPLSVSVRATNLRLRLGVFAMLLNANRGRNHLLLMKRLYKEINHVCDTCHIS